MSITKAEYEHFITKYGTDLTEEIANRLYGLGRMAEEVYQTNSRIGDKKSKFKSDIRMELSRSASAREILNKQLGRIGENYE